MKEVIRIPEINERKEEKLVELTHSLDGNCGWGEVTISASQYDKIVYLGRCSCDGDMFACYDSDVILIFKGHLNSGKYL